MITVYTGNDCAYCAQVKKYLDFKKVKYREINVDEEDGYSREDLKKMTGQARVPVTTNGVAVVQGYNLPQLADLVKGE